MSDDKKVCDTPGCLKPATKPVNLGPGTFVTLCQECYNEETKDSDGRK